MSKQIKDSASMRIQLVDVQDAQSSPACITFDNGTCLYIKVDTFFLSQSICAVGGWFSEPLDFSLEVDGKRIHLNHQTSVFRRDVNEFLHTSLDIKHGFAIITKCPFPKEAYLLAESKLHKICIRISIDISKVEQEDDSIYDSILGRDFHHILQEQLKIHENDALIMEGAIDHCISYRSKNGNVLSIISGWVVVPENTHLLIDILNCEYVIKDIVFFNRYDIDSTFGNILLENQSGYGFVFSIEKKCSDGTEFRLVACNTNTRKTLCKAEISFERNFHKFVKSIFGLYFEWSDLKNIYSTVFFKHIKNIYDEYMRSVELTPHKESSIGNLNKKPSSSIIIPLYGNLKFLDTQMMCFSEDAHLIEETEIIYVIDDTTLIDSFHEKIIELFQLFKVPVRWIYGTCNRGYAAANNLGAKNARGEHLIFMNSDVFPQYIGWVNKFQSYLKENPDTGIAGCRLLYPDGSIQHAGMRFVYKEDWGIWINVHPFTGCSPTLDPATKPVFVPAVTGACMAIRRKDFDDVQGWSTDYLIGDFEDSDLCLKMSAQGKKIVYLPDICLIHLERQTFSLLGDDSYRQRLVIYNAITHQKKWQEQLIGASLSEQVLSAYPSNEFEVL